MTEKDVRLFRNVYKGYTRVSEQAMLDEKYLDDTPMIKAEDVVENEFTLTADEILDRLSRYLRKHKMV